MRTTARPTRENRTITVDFQHKATYVQLLGDGKACVEESREMLEVMPLPGSLPPQGPCLDTSA